MRIANPLLMNDWPIKRFLAAVFVVQLALWTLITLQTAGLEVPILRPLVVLVFLAYLPGHIILRILKMHGLSGIEALLYSVGLSLAFVMCTGLLMNSVYPFIGIPRPISLMPLMISFTALISVLAGIACVKDKVFSAPACIINVKLLLSPPVLFLLLLPMMSVLGTQFVNFYDSNIILMAVVVMIAITAILIGFGKFIPPTLYPFAVFIIGLSLLFYRSLISKYISGFDIHEEYYVANLVGIGGIWSPSANQLIVNSLLSVTILPSITSIIASLDLTWVFKAIYPLLFSLAPLGLYHIFRKQTDERIAFISCFFFVGASQFYTDLAVMPRQQIATVFVICLTLLMIDRKIGVVRRAFLFLVFGVSVSVSHYGLSYVYMFYLVSAWMILTMMDNAKVRQLRDGLLARLQRTQNMDDVDSPARKENTISITFCLLFIASALTWYQYIQDARVFNAFATIGFNIARNVNEFLNPEFSGGLAVLFTKVSPGPLRYLNAAINYFNQFLLILGVIILLVRYKKMKFEKEYAIFSFISLVLIFAGVLVPFLTRQVNMDRLYQIALIFLAPFAVIGGLTSLEVASRILKASLKTSTAFSLISVYFGVFFLFQTGLVWQLTDGYSGSVSISQEGFRKFGDTWAKVVRLYAGTTAEQDVFSAKWLSTHRILGEKIYATHNDLLVHTLTSYGMIFPDEINRLSVAVKTMPANTFVYLQYFNIKEGLGVDFVAGPSQRVFEMTEVLPIIEAKNKIYANGGSEIYR